MGWVKIQIISVMLFLILVAGPARSAHGTKAPHPNPYLYLEPGAKIIENDGAQSMIVRLRQGGSTGIGRLDPDLIRATIFDSDIQRPVPATFQYRHGHLETILSSRKSNRLFIQACQKTASDGKTILKGCAATVYLRGYSSDAFRRLLKQKKTMTQQGEMPLTIEAVGFNYWPKIGDTVTIATAFNGHPIKDQKITVEAPGDVCRTYTTDCFGQVSFAIPPIENSRFKSRSDGLPVIIWTQKSDRQNQAEYISSLTIEAHPQLYDGDNYHDARLPVLGLMGAFTAVFLLNRVHKRRHEDH